MNHYYSLHEDTSGNVAGGRSALVGGFASQACGKTGWQIMNENLKYKTYVFGCDVKQCHGAGMLLCRLKATATAV